MADRGKTRRLEHKARLFQNTITLILLEAGIQTEAATNLDELLRKPGIVIRRQSATIMISANVGGQSGFDISRRTTQQLMACAMALRNTFDRALGIDASIELFSLTHIGAAEQLIMTVRLPSSSQQRLINKFRLRR